MGKRANKFIADVLATNDNVDLDTISRHPNYKKAVAEDRAEAEKAIASATANTFLAGGNDGPFTSKEQRENAFSHPLYNKSQAFRDAVAHKSSQTPDAIMGIQQPDKPMSLREAAEDEVYHARRNQLFDKGNSKDPVEAAQSRLDLINFYEDPTNAAIMARHERTAAETRPYETWLKANGPVKVQAGLQPGDEAGARAQDNARDVKAAGVSMPADLMIPSDEVQ